MIQIDADLQDPELIETFFQRWKQGYDVVYGIEKKSRGKADNTDALATGSLIQA